MSNQQKSQPRTGTPEAEVAKHRDHESARRVNGNEAQQTDAQRKGAEQATRTRTTR